MLDTEDSLRSRESLYSGARPLLGKCAPGHLPLSIPG